MRRIGIHERPGSIDSSREAMRQLASRGSLYTAGMAVQLAAAMVVIPVVTRLLPAEGFGQVATALVLSGIVAVVAGAGLPEAAGRALVGSGGPREAHSLVLTILGSATALVVVAELTGPAWAPVLGLEHTMALRLGIVNGALTAIMLGGLSLLRTADRPYSFMAVAGVASVGAQGLALTLTAVHGTAAACMAGLTVGTGFAALLSLLLAGSARYRLPAGTTLRSALRFGLPLMPHALAILLLAAGDRFAVTAVLGLDEAGRYQVAYAAGSLGVTLLAALNQAWLPLLLRSQGPQRWATLAESSRSVHQLSVVMAGGLALAAPLALAVGAPPSYRPDELVPVAAVVAFSTVPYATLCTWFHVVFLSGRTAVMAIAAPVAAVFNLGLNLLLLPSMGLLGSSVATVAAYVLLTAIAVGVGWRRAPLPGVLPYALCSWAVAAPLVIAGSLIPLTVAGGMVRATLVGLLLGVAVVVINAARKGGRDNGVPGAVAALPVERVG